MTSLDQKLKSVLGEAGFASGRDISEKHACDWSGFKACAPAVLLRPNTSAQVSQVLALCNEHTQAIVVQGGLTGLVGGATPQAGEYALSLERMSGIEELDTSSMTMTALAGTPLQSLQHSAAKQGLFMPLDLGARGSCTIGGNVATNAGGTEVIRYGMTRSIVLGLEVVLADGTILSSMNKMIKNNTGYDLKQLFIGSEGTLGIVTKVVVQLQPQQLNTQSAICTLESYDKVVELLSKLKQGLGSGLTAFELMWANYYHKSLQLQPSLTDPFAGQISDTLPFYLLVEYKDNDLKNGGEQFASALHQQIESGLISDAVIAKNHQDTEKFWQIRDGIGELLQTESEISNQDISLPISKIGEFSTTIERVLRHKFDNIEVHFFGHIGDSNLHICAYTGKADDLHDISANIMQITGEFEGAVSAEHGIGVVKKKYLPLSRSDAEIAVMKNIKQALDPKGILNKGRVI